MTSIAVTASICASASEAALLVASFMSISLDLGMAQRCAGSANDGQYFYSEHPTSSIRFDESPLGESRRYESQIILRRQFDSVVAESASRQGDIGARAGAIYEARRTVATPTVAGYCSSERLF